MSPRRKKSGGALPVAAVAAKRRRRFILFSIPFALLAAAFATKLISMSIIADRTVSLYADSEYEGSMNSAQQQKFVNFLESWKAPYNTGTSMLQLGLLDEARTELEAALPMAEPPQQCPIRANLAITIERQGDARLAADDTAGAVALWQEALAVLDARDPSCASTEFEPPTVESSERIQQKLQQQSEAQEPNEGEEPPESTQSPEMTELEEQLQENQQDRQDELDQERGETEGDSLYDKPW
jgi:tetratricopeptide (TPR) repeat protein